MLNSEFVHCMRTAFNLFMPNGISHCYQLKQSISVVRDVRCIFQFYSNFNRKLCKQTVETLIRHCVRLRRLICVCTINLCPRKRALGIYGSKMQLFCLSHKSCRNLGSILYNIPSESALGTYDLT